MNISNCRATVGLNARVTPTNGAASGTIQVGLNNEAIALDAATKIVSFEALVVGSASDLVLDLSDLDNTGSTAWTAGTAQVETATAVGTITGDGDAEVIVTASGMTGSPKTIDVAVLSGDTASDWAAKVRTALAADAAVSALFNVSGGGAAIVLTRKPTNSYSVKGASVGVYPANDATLNISLDNGTCTGITTAATSANTTSGVATAGAYAPDLTGDDIFGDGTSGLSSLDALFIKNDINSSALAYITQSTYLADYGLTSGATFIAGNINLLAPDDITIEPAAAGTQAVKLVITLAGS